MEGTGQAGGSHTFSPGWEAWQVRVYAGRWGCSSAVVMLSVLCCQTSRRSSQAHAHPESCGLGRGQGCPVGRHPWVTAQAAVRPSRGGGGAETSLTSNRRAREENTRRRETAASVDSATYYFFVLVLMPKPLYWGQHWVTELSIHLRQGHPILECQFKSCFLYF